MSDESNCDSGREQEEHEPCVAASATPHEGKQAMNIYVKQLLAEKQRLDEKSGLDLQLTHKLLANGK
ncbi:hypothetical protein C0J52_26755 [Blattella germanica]|nr:hypothetical protein C0J52_26755 [Blattella germanica]